MFYFKIPEPVHIPGMKPDAKPDEPPFIYSFDDLNDEHVWTAPEWRSGNRNNAMFFGSIYGKIHGRKPAYIVGLTDEEYEVYAPILSMRGKILPRHLAVEFNQLMNPVLLATNEKPKVEVPTNSDSNDVASEVVEAPETN